jgi:hypothetical protein
VGVWLAVMNEVEEKRDALAVMASFIDDDLLRAFQVPEGITLRQRTVLVLRAMGFGWRDVGKAMGIEGASAMELVRKYDTRGLARLGAAIRSALLSAGFQLLAMKGLASIKSEEVAKLPLVARVKVLESFVKLAKEMDVGEIKFDRPDVDPVEKLKRISKNEGEREEA